jgi:F0F1-type ATP synthase membrane subunit c/vacuolar-type H+-ATPase subunit K
MFSLSLILVGSLVFGAEAFARSRTPIGPTQDNVAVALAHACGALLESVARNPSLSNQLMDIYDDHVAEVMSMNLPDQNPDVAEAKGIIAAAFILAYARNPSQVQTFKNYADMCEADINSL